MLIICNSLTYVPSLVPAYFSLWPMGLNQQSFFCLVQNTEITKRLPKELPI